MKVLFLGGPLDGQHREVEMVDGRPPSGICAQPDHDGPTFTGYDLEWRPSPNPVLYTPRRRSDGWVYVAPDWTPKTKTCVAPGCAEPARLVFTVAARGRLAGRDWQPGDQVDTCPGHGNDIHRAQHVYGLDQLAEWLRPDARADLLDIAGIGSGLGAEEYAAGQARTLRMRR